MRKCMLEGYGNRQMCVVHTQKIHMGWLREVALEIKNRTPYKKSAHFGKLEVEVRTRRRG